MGLAVLFLGTEEILERFVTGISASTLVLGLVGWWCMGMVIGHYIFEKRNKDLLDYLDDQE